MLLEEKLELESQLEQELESAGEFEWEAAASRKPIRLPTQVVCGGPPNQTLDAASVWQRTADAAHRCNDRLYRLPGRRELAKATSDSVHLPRGKHGQPRTRRPEPATWVKTRRRSAEKLHRAINLLRPCLPIQVSSSSNPATVPRASNAIPAGRARNRRVDVFLRH